MSYYDSSDNKIRRKKISSNNSNKSRHNAVSTKNKQEINRVNRKEIDKDFELEKELFYKKRDKKRRKRNNIIKKCLTIFLMLTFIGSIFASVLVAVSLKGTPDVTKDLIYNSYVTQNVVPVNEIPDDLRQAIVATEDKRFYKHKGVDFRSLARSVVNNILSESTQGGSTIDMQVSKNLLTSEERTMKRKIRDMYNAMQMNKIMTKDEILSAYLNNIYFGKASYGVADAAKAYFGKNVRDLNLGECAMLAGITNNPAKFMQHDEAKRRQKVVLKHMYDQGYINDDEYREALSDPTPFKSEIA
ncbi:transglycosylase domain-containing protein [Terrisporobacter mayombei]|uniref:Penicillin-binding protein 1A n=1 Tax=Terrisporobacter mayombei TaxID=1541 RepID=A0ABY9PVU8_9FIRM|nr:biosynthetic peptidoglycan transglycosylase [Terrisporobacter mayombei]MCC3869900.1 transglycosylase domain-containing protein [Terrisporobacter mayombei]WMT79791.1 Monofunctional glycosyltransferase [Terrisporobacter mayombei]